MSLEPDIVRELTALSAEDLRRKLGALNIEASPRNQGRTNEQRENWTICRLLASIADELNYPIQLCKGERPDYILTLSDRKIGIEISEASTAAYNVHLSKEARKPSGQQLLKRAWSEISPAAEAGLYDRPRAEGWSNAERPFAEIVNYAIERKMRLYSGKQEGWPEENWLALYALVPLPPLHVEKAMTELLMAINPEWRLIASRLYIEDNSWLFCFNKHEAKAIAIPRIWKQQLSH